MTAVIAAGIIMLAVLWLLALFVEMCREWARPKSKAEAEKVKFTALDRAARQLRRHEITREQFDQLKRDLFPGGM